MMKLHSATSGKWLIFSPQSKSPHIHDFLSQSHVSAAYCCSIHALWWTIQYIWGVNCYLTIIVSDIRNTINVLLYRQPGLYWTHLMLQLPSPSLLSIWLYNDHWLLWEKMLYPPTRSQYIKKVLPQALRKIKSMKLTGTVSKCSGQCFGCFILGIYGCSHCCKQKSKLSKTWWRRLRKVESNFSITTARGQRKANGKWEF